MSTVTGFTAERMLDIENNTVVDGHIDGFGHLILETFGGTEIDAGDALIAVPSASETQEGAVELATSAETITGTDAVRAVTPAGLQSKVASDTAKGIVELATSAETITGTDAVRAVTPAGLAAASTTLVPDATDTVKGRVELATDAETITGTDTARAVTPANIQAKVASDTAKGIVELATTAETTTGTDTVRAVTPAGLAGTAQTFLPNSNGVHGTNAGTANSLATSWGNMGNSFSFTKKYTSTKLRITAMGSWFTTSAASGIQVAIRIDGVDYHFVSVNGTTAANVRQAYCGVYHIPASAVAAGTYTVQGRWRSSNAGSVVTNDTNDFYMFDMTEVN